MNSKLMLGALVLSLALPAKAADSVALLPAGASARFFVPTNGAPGTNWLARVFDDSAWGSVVLPVGFDRVGPPIGVPLADSVIGFSGTQGLGGWSYGYYNRGTDPNGTYNPTTDFISGGTNFGFLNDEWQLGAGGSVGANPPWTSVGRFDARPNTSGGEHWAVRRFTSAQAGRVRLAGIIANAGCGGGVSARIFVDGAQVFAQVVSLPGVSHSLLATVNAGSTIDFLVDPNGSDACDSTRWTVTIQRAAETANVVADSAADFSGIQGQNNWRYGFYNRTADGYGQYDAATEFNSVAADWSFSSGAWRLGADDPPWDFIGASEVHPAGLNNGEEHWVIRRWISKLTGPVTIDWHFALSNPGGEGASLLLFQNGALRDSVALDGADQTGGLRTVTLDVSLGDFIDFACTPLAPSGDDGDGADGSVFRAVIYAHAIHPNAACATAADSFLDWSTNGQQGYRGWTYGHYNRTADPTPGFQTSDFAAFPRASGTFSPTNFWRGFDWDWNPDILPWDNLGRTAAHPNGTNSGPEHWVIRRWTNDVVSGRARVNWFVRKSNPSGAGVTGKVLHNGVEFHSATLSGGDTTGVNRSFDIPILVSGDALDLVLTPLGANGASDDRGDGSANGMTISTCALLSDVVATDIAARLDHASPVALLRVPFHVGNTSCLETVALRVRYDDGFVAWLNGTEIARRNAPTPAGWNSRATASRNAAQALAAEEIDLAGFKGLLLSGANVLAFQAMNFSADDDDLLLAPEITATLTPNQPPAPVDDGGATAMDQPLHFSATQLLGNDSDPDGDPLVLSAVSATSVPGGAVILSGGAVTYTPPLEYSGPDSFTYTVTDGRGGTATATVQLIIVPGLLPAPNQVQLMPLPTGFRLRFAGVPGRAYQVQRSTDLANWITVTTLDAPLHGILEFDDPTALTAAFYRLQSADNSN